MNDDDHYRLPIHGEHCVPPPSEEEVACSPKAYVSNEETAILATMRRLRGEAEMIRTLLDEAGEDREELRSRLEELRLEREELARQWEQANRRKMVMLGHLPPDDTSF